MDRHTVATVSRWVWLINGLVLLSALITAGAFLLAGWLLHGRGADPGETAAAASLPERPATIRYDAPIPVRDSRVKVVLLRESRGVPEGPLPMEAAHGAAGRIVNVGFVEGTGGGRLLLDRPARIAWISFRGAPQWLAGPIAEGAGHRRILYAIELPVGGDSTSGPGLYASSLDGTGLRPLLPRGITFRRLEPQGPEAALVTGVDRVTRRQHAFVLEGDSLRPHRLLDSLASAAAHLARAGAP